MKKMKNKHLSSDNSLEHDAIKERANVLINSFNQCIENLKEHSNDGLSLAIQAMLNCKGKIITTGMGKAGIAMQKFSSTLCSLGTPSCYLHPGEASHGDLGVVQKEDVLFVASTSGKTREVIEVIDLSRSVNQQPIIGLTSHPDSIIRKKADIVVDMGEIEEAGSLKLAPTTSIVVMQILTDTIALILSECRNFSKSDYGKIHHSGYLGALAREDNQIH